jgi:hypothetical protein
MREQIQRFCRREIERIFRESKILSFGGGSAEVMEDLAARRMKIRCRN